MSGDTVILSSRIIPGNEKSIFRVIDHLYRRDANVMYDDGSHGLIHVSGHGSQEEMRLLINLVRPKFFVPVHGDYRYLRRHAEIAMETGSVEHAIVIEDGDVLELDQGRCAQDREGDRGPRAHRFRLQHRRGRGPGHPRSPHPERGRHCAGGAGHQQAAPARLEQPPEVVMRGFGGADVTDQAREVVLKTLDGLSGEQKTDYGMVKEKVRVDLKRLIQKTTGRRPLIMPVIMEI